MKYTLHIADYKKSIKYVVIALGTLFLCTSFIFIPLPKGILIGGFLSIMIIGPTILIIALKRISSKEEIELSADQMKSATFGQIRLDTITSYKVLVSRGSSSLIIKLVDHRKLTLAPSKSISKSAEAEFQEFLKTFKKYMMAVPGKG